MLGIVLDLEGLGNPVAGAVVTPATPGASVAYLSQDGLSLNTTGTASNGIFISIDAPFLTSWTLGDRAGFRRALVSHGKVYPVVVLQTAQAGTRDALVVSRGARARRPRRSSSAAAGEHPGVAVDVAQASLPGSWAVAIDVAEADVVPLGESVGKSGVHQLGDAPADTPRFRWPLGVVPKLGETAAVAGVRRGYTTRPDPELLVIEAQTDAEHLVDLFLGMIERLPSADNLEIRVLDHYDPAGSTDVWLTSRIDAKKILRFLDEHDRDLIDNGHIEINVYVREHKATLRLTEHKTVVWLAEGNALAREVAGWLGELAIPRVDELVTVASVPHFHLRGAKSRDRKKLGDQLFRERLRRVARLPGKAQ